MLSTPCPLVSTRWQFGWLYAGRYSSWKQGRLHSWRYHAFKLCAVSSSSTTASQRARISSIFSSSLSRNARSASSAVNSLPAVTFSTIRSRIRCEMSVQPSFTRSSSAKPPVCSVAKFTSHFCCHPGSSVANHSGSIGWLLRTSTDDGVRWNTYSSCASPRERRDALHGGCAGADDADALVGQVRHRHAGPVAAGVRVVPAARVEGVAGEGLDSGDAGQLGPAQRPRAHCDEPGADRVAAVGADDPARRALIPFELGDRGREQRVVVEVERLRDALAVSRRSPVP